MIETQSLGEQTGADEGSAGLLNIGAPKKKNNNPAWENAIGKKVSPEGSRQALTLLMGHPLAAFPKLAAGGTRAPKAGARFEKRRGGTWFIGLLTKQVVARDQLHHFNWFLVDALDASAARWRVNRLSPLMHRGQIYP